MISVWVQYKRFMTDIFYQGQFSGVFFSHFIFKGFFMLRRTLKSLKSDSLQENLCE